MGFSRSVWQLPWELWERYSLSGAQVRPRGYSVQLQGSRECFFISTLSQGFCSIFFKVPLLSPVLTWFGCWDATQSNVRTLMRRGSCVLLPDGIAGVFHSSRHREVVYVQSRKGFVRLALEEGATLVPVYCFGHSQVSASGIGDL